MATSTPVWTDNVSVHAMQALARNAVLRATLDLRTKWGAYVYAKIGRGGTAALTNGVDFFIRRTVNNGAILSVVGTPSFRSGNAAANGTTCAASGNNAGVDTLTVASTTGFTAGDIICVDNPADRTATEFCRVARVNGSTSLVLDSSTKFAHNDTSHTVRNQAEAWVAWLEGGATYEIIFDYADDAAGDAIVVQALAQTLDSVSIV